MTEAIWLVDDVARSWCPRRLIAAGMYREAFESEAELLHTPLPESDRLAASASAGSSWFGSKLIRHQVVHWRHEIADKPVVLYSEVDCRGRELRKVEEYGSGRLDVAGDGIETGSTRLSETPVPSIEEIEAIDEFSAMRISELEFEAIWRRALDRFEIDD